MAPALVRSRVLRFPTLAAGLLVTGIGIAGFLHLRSERARFQEQVEAQLSAIADLKVSQIVAWRRERIADAAVLSENHLLARQLKSLLLRSDAASAERECRAWLESLARHPGHHGVVLVDESGRARVGAGGKEAPPFAHAAQHVSEALPQGKILLTDIERDESGDVHLHVIAPILDPDRPGVALGGLLLSIDPADFLYPLVQDWPTPSATAESLLFRLDGGSILFLNELRHRTGTALTLRIPLEERAHPAVRFALGERGVITGTDYRGHEVVAAGRAIPGTPWFLVAKVDTQEILAPGRKQAITLVLVVFLLMVSCVGSTALWWRHHEAKLERARFEEEQVREAHARHLELLSEHADDAVLLLDERGRIIRVNDRVAEYYGWSTDELIGQNVRFLRAPDHAEGVDAQIARIRGEGRLRFETVHRRRDGSTVPVEVSARGFDAEGQWFYQAIVRDVSERKRALRAAAYQSELLRNLYDAVIGLDADHVIRSWNPAAERIYGYAAEDVIGRPISEVLPSEYVGYTYPEFKEAVDRAGRIHFEVRRTLPGGRVVDVEGSGVALRDDDGRITGYVTVNRDVTVRKRAEAALRASQERLARILETSSEGIWIIDLEGTTEFANARAAKLFGATPEGLVGRPFLDFVPAPERGNASEDLAAVRRGDGVRRELAMPRPDGSEVWITLSWTALRDSDGRVAGGVGVFMDVTEQRLAREQLLHAQKMDAVGRLASGIAHDFNNLLVSILSCSEFLLESLPAGDPRRVDAEEIKEAGERAARLVRQLLAFGRKSAFRPRPVDLHAVVGGVEGILRRTIGELVTMSFALEPAPWPTRIDPGQLEQVVMNLAVNARDAMPEGGELRIETSHVILDRPPPCSPDLAAGRYAVLTVTDTGCGIPPDVLPMIFEPFFTTKPKGYGTGLGLSTVYGIVKEAGGTIGVTSAANLGTTFTIYLPACEPESAGAERPDAPRERGRGERVLLVEDEDAVRRVTRRVLEENGFRVRDVGSAIEALYRLEEDGPVDLVLTDVVMPEISGPQLAAAVGRLRPDVPVLLMSGHSELQSIPEGARNVLQKPFTADTLVARVHEALGRSTGS